MYNDLSMEYLLNSPAPQLVGTINETTLCSFMGTDAFKTSRAVSGVSEEPIVEFGTSEGSLFEQVVACSGIKALREDEEVEWADVHVNAFDAKFNDFLVAGMIGKYDRHLMAVEDRNKSFYHVDTPHIDRDIPYIGSVAFAATHTMPACLVGTLPVPFSPITKSIDFSRDFFESDDFAAHVEKYVQRGDLQLSKPLDNQGVYLIGGIHYRQPTLRLATRDDIYRLTWKFFSPVYSMSAID